MAANFALGLYRHDIGAEANKSFEDTAKRIREARQTRALQDSLGELNGPNRQAALQRIYALNPQLGMQIEDQLAQRGDRQRAATFRDAAGHMLINGQGGLPAPSASHPAIQALEPHADSIIKGAAIIRQINPTDDATWNNVRSAAGRAGLDLTNVPKNYDPEYVRGVLALADHFGGQGQSQPQTAPQAPPAAPSDYQGSVAQQPHVPSDYERAAMADPEKLLTFQGKQLGITQNQLKATKLLNDQAMQLLGAVHDDASLAAAKQQAHQLYTSFGADSSFIDAIPDTYDPQLIHDLQLRGMNTSQQLNAIARENRVEIYRQNVEADNRRADANQSSLQGYREGRLKQLGSPRPRQSTNRPATPSTVIGGIMQKQASGQPLTASEQQTLAEYRASQHPGRGSRASGSSADLIGPVYRRGKVFVQYSKSKGKYVSVKP